MLNVEKYKDEILKEGGVSHFGVLKGMISNCMNILCSKCAFYDYDEYGECNIKKTNWLCEEYKEPEIDWNNDIDWTKVPTGTPVSVWDYGDNEEGSDRIFMCYLPNEKQKFWTFSNSQRRDNAIAWNHCKLVRTEDVEKYRRKTNA